jgi:hypothetical protein
MDMKNVEVKQMKNYNPKRLQLKDIIGLFDPIVNVVVWTEEEDEDAGDGPSWSGSLYDLPWYYLDYYLGYDDKAPVDGCIMIREDLGEEFKHSPGMVLILLSELPDKK